MKFLKSTITMVALFAIASVDAKVMKRQGQAVVQPTPKPAIEPVIQPEAQPVTETTPAPIFYDEQTNMIKQDFLNNRAYNVLVKNNNNQGKTRTILTGELLKPMNKEWRKRGLKDFKSLQKMTTNQIIETVENEAKETIDLR
jgi:hypothetical protein